MERIGVLAAILLVLVVARVPDASSRVLMADGRGGEKLDSEKVSPSPTPNPSPQTNVSASSAKPQKKSHQSVSPATNSATGSPKTLSPSGSSTDLAPAKSDKNGKNAEGSAGPTKSRIPTDRNQVDSCHASSLEKCDFHELTACLQHPKNDPKGLVLLVENTGEKNRTLKINDVKTPIEGNIATILIDAAKGSIVLNVGDDNCTLHTKDSSFDWNPLQQLPAYATHLTPIYGAYFLFVTMVICGGTWACCKFRRGRRANTGIPYQQLEMGTQAHSTSAVVDSNNTADGWDEGWDEDWDEEEAAPQPSEKHATGSVSANGLTSRSSRKDGWDVDWDD